MFIPEDSFYEKQQKADVASLCEPMENISKRIIPRIIWQRAEVLLSLYPGLCSQRGAVLLSLHP